MPFTAQSLVDQLQVLIPGVTDAEALTYVNRAYKWLLGAADIKTEPLTLTVVSDQQAYDISDDLLYIDKVVWVTGLDSSSRNEGYELEFTPDNTFLNVPTGTTPAYYSIYNSRQSAATTTDSKTQLWISPVYDGTPSGGYPAIKIYGTVYRALTLSPSTAISTAVQFEDAIISRAKQLLFEDYDPSKADFWRERANTYLQETLGSLNKRKDGQGMTLISSVSASRRVAK